MRRLLIVGLLAFGFSAALFGCTSTTIALKEKLGYAKREQLVDRVKEARDEQTETKAQFESALQQFMAVTGATGGDLEAKYNKLKTEYERSETQAQDVRGRIRDVENVAHALFVEWEDELAQYSTESMRAASKRQFDDTKSQYQKLLSAMKAAEAKMAPVLVAFKDQVLFLKHNLNARAIASLQTNVNQIQSDVSRLVAEMEASINEANQFIEQMNTQSK
ncbi:MAG: DUF2959 domain-containing protein [Phycisphaerales bacterium]|nr:DUF2959 domain-containing protein [Phycisphaerales bacterium]